MTTVTFDTLELVDRLKTAGFAQEAAEPLIRVIAEAQKTLVTRDYLDKTLVPIYTDLAVLKTDSTSIKWMIGVLIAGVMSIVIKTFF